MKRKFIITGITCVFLLVSGICYSCSYQKQQAELESVDTIDLAATQAAEPKDQDGLLLAENEMNEDNLLSPTSELDGKKEASVIYVHVCGAVSHPGVYVVEERARVIDALQLAGGLTKEAAGDYLNQAQPITDGQRIYVPTKSELDSLATSELVAGAVIGAEDNKATKNSSLVNINTADATQLMTLPGIGQSKANSIIEYRDANGAFKAIEDLMKVPGIKEGSFGQISDKISVN
jgi:competence protein ComEA